MAKGILRIIITAIISYGIWYWYDKNVLSHINMAMEDTEYEYDDYDYSDDNENYAYDDYDTESDW